MIETWLANPADLMPDLIPCVGFLDDAMYLEIIVRKLRSDVSAYDEDAYSLYSNH